MNDVIVMRADGWREMEAPEGIEPPYKDLQSSA